ncbi:hypothetical protein VST7929_00252 [Vibrio stylophorae]|uniref:YjbQ family protein n=1 Tax=Vibrio stylophorae TaxID=659351 RepID=A0ABN8DRL8_9VIBR|nr:secondary thiamine-phosphate synthase enzyme YjbQ [Vibrio stylophorae]CAH0532423.1 hypothetical protein VST7929_00252 [Vibrio stylophorae]
MWQQQLITLKARSRGFHLITHEVEQYIGHLLPQCGLVHLFLQHTSASLTLNENADPSVRADMQRYFAHAVADDTPYFTHTDEGPDDMPAHIQSSLVGNQLTIPVTNGRLLLGTWQGIYLGEHRQHGGQRRLVVTIQGQ